jgi:hypothetical protein
MATSELKELSIAWNTLKRRMSRHPAIEQAQLLRFSFENIGILCLSHLLTGRRKPAEQLFAVSSERDQNWSYRHLKISLVMIPQFSLYAVFMYLLTLYLFTIYPNFHSHERLKILS